MALNIKDSATDSLAREVASLAGESITEAVRQALTDRRDRLRARAQIGRTQADLIALIGRGRARPILDGRDSDDILGYGAEGLPQ